MTVEWDPEPQNRPPEQSPFWPGAAERRSPRWVPILVAVILVILAVAGLIWWLGQSDRDSADTATSPDGAEEASEVDPTVPDESTAQPEEDGSGSSSGTEEDGTTATSTSTTTTTTTVKATTTTVTTVPPENTDQYGPATLGRSSTVSTVGLDTVTFGMTVAQAQEAAGTVLVPTGPTGACYHVVPFDAPEGIVFLVHHGTIERVDINSGPITTRSGVGVGSPEDMVSNLFSDSIEREVRVDGTVDLVFVPTDPGDRNYRVVFNVSEGAVRAYKSGRLPQVMLDTGCESE